MKFSGQVVWITGASSGIGEALAHAFAREGARLVLSSRRREELERVRRACARSEEHFVLPLDLTRSETFPAAVAAVLARCGHIDVLVNNGGVAQRALATDTALEVERALMEIDYFGPVALTKAALPSMRTRGAGRVVVVSSVLGHIGIAGNSTYCAAKHALHGYFDSLRAEIWRDGIGVTLVCPGYVRTAVRENAVGPQGETGRPGVRGRWEQGISSDKCAAKILRAVGRNRAEIYVGREAVAIYLMRFVPWLFFKIARRIKFPVKP